MTNTEALKAYINKSGYKLGYIASSMGIARATLYEKINNKSAFNQFEIQKICELLKIDSPSEIQRIFFDRSIDKNVNIVRAV